MQAQELAMHKTDGNGFNFSTIKSSFYSQPI